MLVQVSHETDDYRAGVLNWGQLAPLRASGNVCRHFWLTQPGGVGTTGIQGLETRGAAKHPTEHRMVPTTKSYSWSNTLAVLKVRNTGLEPLGRFIHSARLFEHLLALGVGGGGTLVRIQGWKGPSPSLWWGGGRGSGM